MKTIKVWGPFVHLFHWSLVMAVICQLATAEAFPYVHVKVGCGTIVLLAARIVWGFTGPKHARFDDVVYAPKQIIAYLKRMAGRRPTHYIGHNPAGGAMVCLLLFVLLLTTAAGLKTLGAMGKGPLAHLPAGRVDPAYADQDHDDAAAERHGHDEDNVEAHFWKEIHETLAGVVIFLVVVPICGVLVSSYLHKGNLTKAMITGKKPIADDA